MNTDFDRLDHPVFGRHHLSLLEQLIVQFWVLLRRKALLGVLVALLWAGVVGAEWISAGAGAAAEQAIMYGLFALVLYVGLIVWMTLIQAVTFLRWPEGAKRLVYEVGEEGMLLRDETGVSLNIPWASTRRVALHGGFLFLRQASPGWRALPEKAFAPADFARIVARARRAERENAGK